MKDYFLLIASGCIGALVTALVGLGLYFRRVINEKDKGTIRHIRKQDQLNMELTKTQIEKKMLEQLLQARLMNGKVEEGV